MMRLPLFQFRAPRSLAEAARILDGERANAMPLAGEDLDSPVAIWDFFSKLPSR